MDPLTLVLIVAGIAWSTAAPDQRTLRATRGTVGAVRAVHHGAVDHLRSEWANGGARAKKRTERRKKWAKHPVGQVALLGEWAGIYGWRAGRSVVRATRAGLVHAPSAYRSAAQAAVDRRAARGPGRLQRWATSRVDRTTRIVDQDVHAVDQDDMSGPDGPARCDDAVTGMDGDGDVRETDLQGVDDLRQEVHEASGALETMRCDIGAVCEWASSLPDRMSAAGWGTDGISGGVAHVSEVAGSSILEAIDQIEEALNALLGAVGDAESVGDAAGAQGAHGDVSSFKGQ